MVSAMVLPFDHDIASNPSLLNVFCFCFFFSVPCRCNCCQKLFPSDRQKNEIENICSDLFLLGCELADEGMIGYFKLPVLRNFKDSCGVCGWKVGWGFVYEKVYQLYC